MNKVASVIKPEILQYFKDFLEDANEIEIEGLAIINEVKQTGGKEDVSSKFPQKKSDLSQDFDRLRNEYGSGYEIFDV